MVSRAALSVYRALGCRDVARIDCRLRHGMPYFLQATPLPGPKPEAPDFESEQQVIFTVDIVSKNLSQAGYAVRHLGVSTDPQVLLDGLRDLRPDVIFNLFEGLPDQGGTEAFVAGLLEWSGVPFTGSP